MSVWQEAGQHHTWVIGISARLDHEQTPLLEKMLISLLSDQQSRLIIDMSETTYVNSGGLRALVTGWRNARQQGGDLLLCGLADRVLEVFTMVGFHKVFELYDTLDDAFQAWQAKPVKS